MMKEKSKRRAASSRSSELSSPGCEVEHLRSELLNMSSELPGFRVYDQAGKQGFLMTSLI